MSDDSRHHHPADAVRIRLEEPWEIEYWSREFDVTPERLFEAVARVGFSAAALKASLGRR